MASTSAAAIPFVGSWKLYFHDPANNNWGPDDYILLATITSWSEYWIVMNAISDSQFEPGGLFFMHGDHPPRYEHYSNKRGGGYQIQVSQTEDYRKTFDVYCIAMIQRLISRDPANSIVGVTISLKRGFYILKLWNTNAALYNKIEDIRNYAKPTSSMLYQKHNERNS
jgi:hypothetical protein